MHQRENILLRTNLTCNRENERQEKRHKVTISMEFPSVFWAPYWSFRSVRLKGALRLLKLKKERKHWKGRKKGRKLVSGESLICSICSELFGTLSVFSPSADMGLMA